MIFVRVLLPLCLVLWMYTGTLCAQSSTDSAAAITLRIYTNTLRDQSPLYNGPQYNRYPARIHYGHPFFMADSIMTGQVTYDGLTFPDVPLLYDEVNDQLITTDFQGNNLVVLSKNNVQSFSIGQHQFTHLEDNVAGAGYFRLIYDGTSKVIVKEIKSIQVKNGRTTEETERSVFAATNYYLLTQQGYRKFNRLTSFLTLFGDKQKQVANFIKSKRLKYKNNREDVITQAATFYDQLTN